LAEQKESCGHEFPLSPVQVKEDSASVHGFSHIATQFLELSLLATAMLASAALLFFWKQKCGNSILSHHLHIKPDAKIEPAPPETLNLLMCRNLLSQLS
jgi:hypothetical protein